MSVPPEEMRLKMQALLDAGVTPEMIRKQRAVERASRVGTQSMGAPSGEDRTFLERVTSAAAGVAKPILETVQGVQELNLESTPEFLQKGAQRRMAGTEGALDWAEETQTPGAGCGGQCPGGSGSDGASGLQGLSPHAGTDESAAGHR